MGHLKLSNKSIVLCTMLALLFVGCVLTAPSEPKLELQLGEQAVGEPFSFADYCKEEYDSIYIILPYSDEESVWSLPYSMSKSLRENCSYTLDDTIVRLLFINDGTVRAYSEIGGIYAYFPSIEFFDDKPILSIDQPLILDENRYVHIYKK